MTYYNTKTYTNLLKKHRTNNPDKIIIHHSGGVDSNPLADTSHHTAEMMEAWHISKGWQGLGYHYVIHKNGDIWRGRPEHVEGAHTVNQNKTSIGIVLSGNFDATHPTEAQMKSLTYLIKEVARNNPSIIIIKGHRDFAVKTCPGKNFTNKMIQDLIPLIKKSPEQVLSEPVSDPNVKLKKSLGKLWTAYAKLMGIKE